MTLWRFGREDRVPLLTILALPLLVAVPQIIGWLKADPILHFATITLGRVDGILRGFPHIDPNAAYTTQALGYRSALEWLQGNVPWWNPYSGVGLPLAGEYQPGSFFPLTLLWLLADGATWQMVALQVLCGVGTYGLLRQTGVGRLAATTGGVLYAFNGTLAWFSHSPATALPFLPFFLWGIERAYTQATLRASGGWRLFALAMALSLVASFPETAYIDGLLGLAWAIVRGVQMAPGSRRGYAARIAWGGIVGIALAAPQLFAFASFLPHAFVGLHSEELALAAMPPHAAIPSLVAPYAYGPIFSNLDLWDVLPHIWGGIGGFVTLLVVVAAIYGFGVRRGALAWLLLAWSALAIARTFSIEPAVTLLNLVPGVSITAFARYAPPSWELALIVLACWGLDDLARNREFRRAAWGWTAAALVIALAAVLLYGAHLWPALVAHVSLRNSFVGSLAWAAASAVACLGIIRCAASPRAAPALALLLAFEALVFFALPTLSMPRGGAANLRAIGFLRDNLGLNRFFTLGPIEPNYGAYFGIASINHNYLPVSERWVKWITAHLDRGADAIVFNGHYARAAGLPTPVEELRRNLAAYEWVGVKYVVTPPRAEPFAGVDGIREAYADETMSIFELRAPKPYFEAIAGRCRIEPHDRTRAVIDCENRAMLLRRELFYPGWTATVNGNDAPIAEHRELFQAIELPAGRNEVRFSFAPPLAGWSWVVALAGATALLAGLRRKR